MPDPKLEITIIIGERVVQEKMYGKKAHFFLNHPPTIT
jgi:hypothetical protein